GKLKSADRISFKQGLLVIWRAVPSLLMIVIVVGGILAGFFTATESAAIAVVYCLVLSAAYRPIKVLHMPDILVDAGRTTAIVISVGPFMDPTPAILLFVPIFLPIVTEFGIDPVHFGAMVVMNLSLGVITPPVGNVLFVGARLANLRIEPVIAKLWPFLVAILAALFLVVFIPQLSLWLPTTMGLM